MSLTQIRPAHLSHSREVSQGVARHRRFVTAEAGLAAGTFAMAAIVKVHPGPLPGDLDLTLWFQHLILPQQWISNGLDFISMITWPQYVIVLMALLVVLLSLLRRWLDTALILLTSGAADGSNFIISQFDRRPRPEGGGLYIHSHITNFFSFPSGHVEHVLALFGLLIFLSFQIGRPSIWMWAVRAALLAMIVLMGPARLIEGEHWPSDVVAGWLWGGFWLVLAIQVYQWASGRWPRLLSLNERRASPGAADSHRDVPGTSLPSFPQLLRDSLGHPSGGLTEMEVQARRVGGLGNTEVLPGNRTYGQIVRHNLLTFINCSLLGLGVALVALGRPLDALSAVGLICFNAVVTAAQEIRTKRTLDRSLTTESLRIGVVRAGQHQRIPPRELVLGDLVEVAPGDRIVVDGRIVDGQVVVDDSLLSGKPECVSKRPEDHLISGSRCVGGSASYVAERVGARSAIHRVAAHAARFRRGPSPLQKQINFVFSLSLIAAIYIELLLVVRAIIAATDLGDSLEQSAVIANLVPESVVLTIALAYAIGAVRVLRAGALAQEASAVESLSNLTVLCLDKTGTLTATRNRAEATDQNGGGAFNEELRPDTRAGLAALVDAGVEIKVISGDDPARVARVAAQAGIVGGERVVSGHELLRMDELELENAVETCSIFGGVSAEQKGQIVQALQKRGHYVGMVGDGLNDVPALKRAHVGIALQSGSGVARDAADMILLNDSLTTLARIMAEGQRIVHSLQPALKLFLTRITATALIILSSLTVAEVFPIRLRHGTILTILTVAIPTVLLALWARPGPVRKDGPLQQLAHFVIPAALISSMVGLLLFYGVLMLQVLPFVSSRSHYTQAQLERILQRDLPAAQTELASFLVVTGLVLVIFVAPPTKWWTGGSPLSGDWRPTLMAGGLIMVFCVLLEVPLFRSLFGLAPLGAHHLAAVAVAVMLWLLLVRTVWRVQLGERLFKLERKPGGWYRHATDDDADPTEPPIPMEVTSDTERQETAVP